MAKHTPLAEIHAELDAKMIPYHGWSVPAGYPGGAIAEHRHTRKYCSIFDSGFCGKIRVAGPGCAAKLDDLMLYKVSMLPVGQIQKNYLLADDGTFIDAPDVFRMAEDDYFIVANAANTAKVLKCLEDVCDNDSEIQDLTEAVSRIDLYGPESLNVLLEAGVEESELPAPGSCKMLEISEIRCIASRIECCGENGVELFCGADNAIDLWDELTCIEPVCPAGMAAAESLRIEMGYPRWGNELTSALTPLDCGLEIPEKDFAGKAALLQRSASFRTAFAVLDGRQTAKTGDLVFSPSGEEIGVVSSGTAAPSLEHACVICRISAEYAARTGDTLHLHSGKNILTAVVCTAPFYKPKKI